MKYIKEGDASTSLFHRSRKNCIKELELENGRIEKDQETIGCEIISSCLRMRLLIAVLLRALIGFQLKGRELVG